MGHRGQPSPITETRVKAVGMVDLVEPDESKLNSLQGAGEVLVEKILRLGLEGSGPWQGAQDIVGTPGPDLEERERTIDGLISSHRRLVAVGGFVTGFGGLVSMVVTIPADIGSFFIASGRMTAATAHLRGYDVNDDAVRSMVLVSLLGASGPALLSDAGVRIGTTGAVAALRNLPADRLAEINQKVGYRLVTSFGEKGVINLVKVIPVIGGGIGAGVNVASINIIARHAKANFPLPAAADN
jgi:hypothetical protein